MGEFKTSFNSILRRDLKHIYSGFPQPLSYRHSNPYPTQEQLKMKEENTKLKAHVLKSSEFVPEYSCLIPRAPAFRILSRHDVNGLVQRLSTPTVASQGISNTSDKSMLQEKQKSNAKYLGLRNIDYREQTAITARLARPTHSSRQREFQTRSHMVTSVDC
ncbi:uncharacterized protein LOC128224484 isoform X2 [Mya arenaria]|uniref:uncharacterized protein LOC128224484 isoform X2 n=1 Tax=Mya arenaria TaxID=6604 RepID=UPI0022DFC142|nr:uncharacterized protein LOC128224484 isoform X2 [Mya arenaria]